MTSERFCHKTKTDKAYYYERYRTQHRAIILLLQLESSFPLFFLPNQGKQLLYFAATHCHESIMLFHIHAAHIFLA